MPAALERVKQELGPEAVILGTRSISVGAVGRLVGRPGVEITAAPAGASSVAPRINQTTRQRALERHTAAPRLRPAPASKPPLAPPPQDTPVLPEQVYPYYLQLVQSEVAEQLAQQVVRTALQSLPQPGQASAAEIRAALQAQIAGLIPTDTAPSTGPTARCIALVGPPGGGKSTTIAKLAAQYRLRERRTVGLLSLDTQRLDGGEPLRRFAEILGVQHLSAQTIDEVKRALNALTDVECLLIDTPGVGPREQGLFARVAALLRAARPDELHLVLPAHFALSAQSRAAAAFAPLRVSRLVLTHLDEVAGLGVLLNVAQRLNLGLSYVTTGQNVPKDIEKACSRRLAELIMPAKS